MDKSYNDIKAQVERCIALANELGGRWTANARHRANVQYFAQLGSKVRTQRGISMFEKDKDTKHPLLYVEAPKPEPDPEPVAVVVEQPKPAKVEPTPTEKAKNRMTFNDWMDASPANRKQIQDQCRHAFINKMYAELISDMTYCQYEGWDVLEFPRMLRAALDVCFPKKGVQLSLFNN